MHCVSRADWSSPTTGLAALPACVAPGSSKRPVYDQTRCSPSNDTYAVMVLFARRRELLPAGRDSKSAMPSASRSAPITGRLVSSMSGDKRVASPWRGRAGKTNVEPWSPTEMRHPELSVARLVEASKASSLCRNDVHTSWPWLHREARTNRTGVGRRRKKEYTCGRLITWGGQKSKVGARFAWTRRRTVAMRIVAHRQQTQDRSDHPNGGHGT